MLQLAREWHVAPWEIEQNMDRYWWEHWQAMRETEAEVNASRADKGSQDQS